MELVLDAWNNSIFAQVQRVNNFSQGYIYPIISQLL